MYTVFSLLCTSLFLYFELEITPSPSIFLSFSLWISTSPFLLAHYIFMFLVCIWLQSSNHLIVLPSIVMVVAFLHLDCTSTCVVVQKKKSTKYIPSLFKYPNLISSLNLFILFKIKNKYYCASLGTERRSG